MRFSSGLKCEYAVQFALWNRSLLSRQRGQSQRLRGRLQRSSTSSVRVLKDREAKQQVDEILGKVRELKQSASELEDENRELREKLRFKSGDYEFCTPFWYHKVTNPDQALCPRCFAGNIAAPMGEPGQGCSNDSRRCLVCGYPVELSRHGQESRGGSGLVSLRQRR